MQDKKVVHFEEQPLPAIDEVMKNGDIEFDISNSKEHYAIFDRKASFGIKRIAGVDGEAYSLSCLNSQ